MIHYISNTAQTLGALAYGVGYALFYAVVVVYLSYLGLEPYMRRRWPGMLISWSRALSGRFSDPRVGSDVLAGCAAGVILVVAVFIPGAVLAWLNLPGPVPYFPYPKFGQIESSVTTALRGIDGALTNAIYDFTTGVGIALSTAAMLLIARLLVRRNWIAVLVLGVILSTLIYSVFVQNRMGGIPGATYSLSIAAIWIFVLFRFGILGLATALFTSALVRDCVITLDFSRWYIASSLVALVILAALAIHGFHAALADRPLFGRALLED